MKQLAAFGLSVAIVVPGAAVGANVFDSLFGGKAKPESPAVTARSGIVWQQPPYDYMRLQPSEAPMPNAQPTGISAEALGPLLASVQLQESKDKVTALFSPAEVERLAPALAEALRRADPKQDIVFFSSDKRGEGLFAPRLAVTGRAFHTDDSLNLIVGTARLDFFDQYRAAGVMPTFSHGSRAKVAPVDLRAEGAGYPGGPGRHDWLAWQLAQTMKPAEPAVAAPRTTPERVGPRDDKYFDEQEQRLRRIQRLREQNLITEQEYQEKRKEILRDL